MVGKVIEGRYAGYFVHKAPESKKLYIEIQNGEKIIISKNNAISIDDVTSQYNSTEGKVIMVMWDDFETSIIMLGTVQKASITSTDSISKSKSIPFVPNDNHSASHNDKSPKTVKANKVKHMWWPIIIGACVPTVILLAVFFLCLRLGVLQFASTNQTPNNTITYSVSGDTELIEHINTSRDDVVLSVGDLLVTDAKITFDKGSKPEYDKFEYSFTVLNNSKYDLESFSIDCVITDLEGTILDKESAWVDNTVASGKKAVLSGTIYVEDYTLPICIVPDEYLYDGNGDNEVFEVSADPDNAKQYTIEIKNTDVQTEKTQDTYIPSSGSNSTKSNSDTSKQSISQQHTCVECGISASKTYTNPFSGKLEYYCTTHYQEIIDIMSMMEDDVGSSKQSKHTCEQCSREGTHRYESFTGQTEYYCTQHYEELKDLLDTFGLN